MCIRDREYGVEEYGDNLFYLKDDAPKYDDKIANASDENRVIRLSTTTPVKDSGLLDYILPVFEQEYGYKVEVQSAGTGKAIAAAKYGNADVILVHSKAQEEAFVDEGFSYVLSGFDSERLSFMYNYFVLCLSLIHISVRLINKYPRAIKMNLPLLPHTYALKYAVGMKMDLGRFIRIGERSYNVERAVNAKFGVNASVSYTHLDVYKRQQYLRLRGKRASLPHYQDKLPYY